MTPVRQTLLGALLGGAMALPLALAAFSPLLAWRQPIYVAAGFAGIAGFALMLVQPALIRARALGLSPRVARKGHRAVGMVLVFLIIAHVAGLWVTSPPDMIDALLLRSPTPFSIWGVLAMWALCALALATVWRAKLGPRRWRVLHVALLAVIVPGTIAHVLLIEGTMELTSKWVLSLALLGLSVGALRLG